MNGFLKLMVFAMVALVPVVAVGEKIRIVDPIFLGYRYTGYDRNNTFVDELSMVSPDVYIKPYVVPHEIEHFCGPSQPTTRSWKEWMGVRKHESAQTLIVSHWGRYRWHSQYCNDPYTIGEVFDDSGVSAREEVKCPADTQHVLATFGQQSTPLGPAVSDSWIRFPEQAHYRHVGEKCVVVECDCSEDLRPRSDWVPGCKKLPEDSYTKGPLWKFYQYKRNAKGEMCPPVREEPQHNCAAGKGDSGGSGNPLFCTTGEKTQSEFDFQSNDFSLTRLFRGAGIKEDLAEPGGWALKEPTLTLKKILSYDVAVFEHGELRKVFVRDVGSASWTSDDFVPGSLVGTVFTDDRKRAYAFDATGKLTSLTYADGNKLSISRVVNADGSSVETLTSPNGRVSMQIKNAAGQLLSFTAPDGNKIQYEYEAGGRLKAVVYPDDTPANAADNPRRSYVYEDIRYPHLMTGIIDENGDRYATYAYDARMRGIKTEHAGGAGRVTLDYISDTQTQVRHWQGASQYREELKTFVDGPAGYRITSITHTACADCPTRQNETFEFNSNQWLTKHSDASGRVTTYVRNSDGSESSRTEAFGTIDARTINTSWNWTFGVPSSVTQGSRTTSTGYDSAGRVTHTNVYDSGQSRITWYTYNAAGRLEKIDGPRTDITDHTTYTYDSFGNVLTVTNALGHVTTMSQYDANGRVGKIVDANGLETTLAYTPRGWLKSRTVGGLTTNFTYDKVGQLTRVTAPDGSFVQYRYDAAHRLVGIENALGEKIAYTLDWQGNRTKEEVFDALGNSVRAQSSRFNALNQLVESLNAANQTLATYSYDAAGNLTGTALQDDNGSRSSTQEYDQLNRLKKLTDALSGVSEFGYDALDQLTRVKDPRSLSTSYDVDVLGNLKTQTSPDTGATSNTFDSAGNLLTSTNARAHKTTYSYDALNRVTQIKYHDNRSVLFAYDDSANGNYGKGRLTSVTDASQPGHTGSTTYKYDQAGRLLQKSQIIGAVTRTTKYSYDSYGRVSTMTLPSNKLVKYSYNSAGQINQISIGTTAYLKSISYSPFGPAKSWTWNDNTFYSRSFDANGRLTSYPLDNQSVTLSYDRQGRLTTQSGALVGSHVYDALDRLTSATRNGQTESFSFDANGNRLSRTLAAANDSYVLDSASNRLSSISGQTKRSYQYDAAGNTLSDGTRTYTYDTANRLTQIVKGAITQTQSYNGLGQRVKKSVTQNGSTVSTLYAYDESGQLIGEYNGSGTALTEVVYLDGQPVLAIKGSTVYGIQADQLNSPRGLYSFTAKKLIWRWDSAPYGDTAANEDPDGNGTKVTFHWRFPGQVIDIDTGLHYNYFRDYDPVTGRYIESDPIGVRGGVGTYTYANGSPIESHDRLGLAWTKMDFWRHYRGGNGGTINLGDTGLLDEFRSAMSNEVGQVFEHYKSKLLSRLQQKCKGGRCDSGSARVSDSFQANEAEKSYYFTPSLLSALWVLGNGQLFNKGSCSGFMNCQTGQWGGGCGLHFYVRDWFKDPFDIFNNFDGSSDGSGTPYRINGDWGESRSW